MSQTTAILIGAAIVGASQIVSAFIYTKILANIEERRASAALRLHTEQMNLIRATRSA